MRSILELFGHLRAVNVSLALDGDALKCSAPQGVLTADLRQELADRKPEIVAFLRSSQDARRKSESGIPRVDRSGPLPLSYAQQRLWFLNQLDPDSAVNNLGIALRMKGHLIVSAVDRALAEIVSRHEDLRTSFIRINGAPHAVIADGKTFALQVIDATHLANSRDDSELNRYANQLTFEPFDMSHGPLFRAYLLQVGPDDHILALTMHHIVSDGWSMGVLVREFSELYPAYASGRQHSLAPLTVQYVDFAAWQRTWLESGELDRQLPYWKKQLAGAPPVVGFPPDHRRPATDLFRGCRSPLMVPKPLVSALEQLSQRNGVTLFMTLLAAFKLLLARYSGLDDVVVGTPSANRSRAELHPLIGFFVNNLVLRTDLSGNPTFAELLGRVREVTLGAYEHQDVPFDTLVHAMHAERSLDHSPLFQVMFILQNFPLEDLNLPGLKSTPLEPEVEHARFDLTVEVFPRKGELCAYFDYNADIYDPETIARLQQHYLALLQAVCVDPSQKTASIPLLSASERHQLLVQWNQTEAEIPKVCFYQRFEMHARATPDRVAVVAGEASLTYSELDQRANRIAAELCARGAGPEKLVAICIARSADLVAALLAVAKSGAAYVPLDPSYPAGRIVNILEDAKPLVILTTTDLSTSLFAATGSASSGIINLDKLGDDATHASPEQQDSPQNSTAHPDNLAYVIFTSGSTGRPKGVQNTHRALVNFLDGMSREPGFNADDVLLAVTTVSFDIASLELLLPLYVGATVCIALQPGNPAHLLADFDRYRPTVMQATPATWKLMIAAGWRGDPNLKILCGGESLDVDLARSLLVRSQSLWNMYGPTETTIWSAVLPIEQVGSAAIPVGRPMQNTSFYVLDELGEPTPFGVAGELWIGGDGLARGYLNRPDLTAERFMLKSFPEVEQNNAVRLYRTGDLVRYRKDGTLDFLGRMDYQVKLRGFRIELGEIESVLRNFPAVADAVTVLRENNNDKSLVAYLVSSSENAPSVSDLRDHLRVTLPEYMIPAAFVLLDELPRLPNGKLDRTALPAPEQNSDLGGSRFVPAENSLQQAISAAFCSVLAVEQVGIDQNFFDLGAHSLQIVRVHEELNQRAATKVQLISFFQYPTIRTLAAFIEQQGHDEGYETTNHPIDRQVRTI